MRDRFENRFRQVREQSASPLAYAGLTPEFLDTLESSDAHKVIEALVRKRAEISHTSA